ncbi:calmodulin-binding transcription activator 4 [Diospyros lotus]|uniref:calmodulin-binding transcription activator 4 n=1 Tax=Diospyros lotus TaxID=55363 RepID=UPI002256E3D7|nr:calmodulin-binding transcription activator 4 [Diospyros lotus]
MIQSGYNIDDLVQEAQTRWLKPAEVLFILQNYNEDQLTHEPPQKPSSGSWFLFNKRILRFFRKDGHSWRKKKDGRTVGEAHERLKVGNVEALNCYYAHGEKNPNFQRRSYWMLDPAHDHIVLVHYRETSEGRHNSGSISQSSPGSSSTFSQSPTSHTTQHPGSTAIINKVYEPYQSPESVEVSSDDIINSKGNGYLDRIEGMAKFSDLPDPEVSQALQRLKEQLSLDDDSLEGIDPVCNNNENSNEINYFTDDEPRSAATPKDLYNLVFQRESDHNGKRFQQVLGQEFMIKHNDSLSWKEMLEFSQGSPGVESQEKIHSPGMELPHLSGGMLLEQERHRWINFPGHNSQNYNDFLASDSYSNMQLSMSNKYLSNSESVFALLPSMPLSQEVESFNTPVYFPGDTDPNSFASLFDQDHIGINVEADSSLTISQKQKFTIREISPEWGFASETTKVIIVGSFLCDPSEGQWTCMFGDTEVPVHIIQEGVLCCQAPPHLPGKVTLCITSGNRESCSEVREFEYHVSQSAAHYSSFQTETTRSAEELLLLVRFVRMLLSEPLVQKDDATESRVNSSVKYKAGEDSWDHAIGTLLVGGWASSSTTDWLLQELLKDKFQQWLSYKSKGGYGQSGCSLSKKEQGVIHMVAGLGFDWALNPILNCGVSINFRDINGWTALHWAAQFGREKMVAALIASGASAGAVTDPNSHDRVGKTPASIAATSGHKGLAGYLSEVAVTSYLSSLTLEETELSKSSADVEAEITVNSISQRNLGTNEDHLDLKDTLAAVRNTTQAAARIQAAFRAHSFRKRQQREAALVASDSGDEYSILSNDIPGLSAAAKLTFGTARDYNAVALAIQKNYRGWKGRRDFLALRRKVVKIQAHFRGHRVRKQFEIKWAVSILEKVVLRWRRKGVGLRGFQHEMECVGESEDEEDILKVFRKQKVDKTIDEAVSRVLSMVDSPEARQQYRRMLERYRQAKAELEGAESVSEVTSASQWDVSYMEDAYQLLLQQHP